jgi:hypothetical protein
MKTSSQFMAEFWIPTEADIVMVCLGARIEASFMYLDVGMYIPTSQRGDYFIYLPWIGGTFLL